jgi:hypothetical protein
VWRDVTLIICGGVDDVASINMIDNWINEVERRVWLPARAEA